MASFLYNPKTKNAFVFLNGWKKHNFKSYILYNVKLYNVSISKTLKKVLLEYSQACLFYVLSIAAFAL